MKQLTINIPDNKYQFFLELVKSLKFAQVDSEGDSKEEIIANLKQGFKEVQLHKQGKLKTTSAKDFLNEL